MICITSPFNLARVCRCTPVGLPRSSGRRPCRPEVACRLVGHHRTSPSDWTLDSATITSVRPKPPKLDSKAAHVIQRGAVSFATRQLASFMISVSQP